MPICASSDATTRSAQSAKSLPPPTHHPCTCAITGFGARHTHMSFWVGALCGAVANAKSLPASHSPPVVIWSSQARKPPPKS